MNLSRKKIKKLALRILIKESSTNWRKSTARGRSKIQARKKKKIKRSNIWKMPRRRSKQ